MGIQARLQARLLKDYTINRNLWVWGRNPEKVVNYAREMAEEGFQLHLAETPQEVAKYCNLIVTTTAARSPLIYARDLKPGTHITAVGADVPSKQELDPEILQKTDCLSVDSKEQCLDHGESAYCRDREFKELGSIISDPGLGRRSEQELTVADLTGVGVQDIQMAKAVL